MKKYITIGVSILLSFRLLGGFEFHERWYFYNLFKQTNISASQYYPFLRVDRQSYYNYYSTEGNDFSEYNGNLDLWQNLLVNVSREDLVAALYSEEGSYKWKAQEDIEKRAQKYIDFARDVGDALKGSKKRYSWKYKEILKTPIFDSETLLPEAYSQLEKERNEQLRARYFYQIIRLLRYSGKMRLATALYKSLIEGKLPENEIYFYIMDQVAGCYYSMGNYEEAAYMFATVFGKSRDRKTSAFSSYNFCTFKNAKGEKYINGLEDEKRFFLIRSLRNFADDIYHINEYIQLDAADPGAELLFMRAVNKVERDAWPTHIEKNETYPADVDELFIEELQNIAESQISNQEVQNKDFWQLCSSYLSFITKEVDVAKEKLASVKVFPEQTKALNILYNLFSWEKLSAENEEYLYTFLQSNPIIEEGYYGGSQNDLRSFVLQKAAHTYYINDELAKAFLIHHDLTDVNNIHSLELLDQLEEFYLKKEKSSFEEWLLAKYSSEISFSDYIKIRKGIYHLYTKEPEKALNYFQQSSDEYQLISPKIFSNNIMECFNCGDDIMEDEVYKSRAFSFISKSMFSRGNLAKNIIELEKLATDQNSGKSKLAHYLLGNYYFNISNTGYYRGILTNTTNSRWYIHLEKTYGGHYQNAASIIEDRSGYNMAGIDYFEKHYFALADKAFDHYQKVIDLSDDQELNARCTYMMAKCELNDFYNNGNQNTFTIPTDGYSWNKLDLPKCSSYDSLREKYSETDFHQRIIKECSYYRYYSNNF